MNTHFNEVVEALSGIDERELEALYTFIEGCDGTLWIAGNGGSAAIAIHWACDFSKAAGFRAQTLGTNLASLTAWSNDIAYGSALSNELQVYARRDDRLLCLSCSGTSGNIITALRQAWLLGIPRALVTQQPWLSTTPVDFVMHVPSTDPAVIEDVFGAIGHALTKQLTESK